MRDVKALWRDIRKMYGIEWLHGDGTFAIVVWTVRLVVEIDAARVSAVAMVF